VLYDAAGAEVTTGSKYLGTATNNIAEYTALILGLEQAQQLGISELICHLDSELAVKQINGIYKVKNAGLRPLWQRVGVLREEFARVEFVHVRRELNKRADQLANRAMDAGKQ